MNDSDFFILLSKLNNYSAICEEFESIFFDPKSNKIVKKPDNNLELIKKNSKYCKLLSIKYKVILNNSNKNIQNNKKIIIEICCLIKKISEYNIQNLKEELKKIYNIIVLYEIYDIIDGILEKICKI